MLNESGIQKNLGNFKSLIAYCVYYNEKYNPGNPDLSIYSLNMMLTNTKDLVKAEVEQKVYLQRVINQRAAEFEDIGQLSGRIINAMIGSGIEEAKVEDANAHHRKLNGRRAPGSNKNKETNKENEESENPKGSNSVSQLGFDDKLGHFEKLIEVLKPESLYRTNEADLNLTALEQKWLTMDAVNSNVKSAQSAWEQSIIKRNEAFNNDKTGMVAIVRLVKGYVKSVFLENSPQFKQLSALQFKKLSTR